MRRHRQSGLGRKFVLTRTFGMLFSTVSTGFAYAAVSPPPPSVDAGTTFELFVADVATYDDNIYRVPNSFGSVKSLAAPNATRGDFVDTASAGGTGQWIVGLQDLDLTVRADYSRFANNTELNNTGFDAVGNWNWRVGSYFSGTAGAELNRTLASFAETRYLGRDLVTNKNYYGTARWQLGPHWATFGGVRLNDIDHGASVARFSNFKTQTGSAGVEYATSVANTFQAEYLYSDGKYPGGYTFDGVPFDRDFHENEYRINVKYVPTEKTEINAYAGYLKHVLPDFNILSSDTFGNFSGDVWRFSVNWLPTEKTQVLLSGWHELHAFLANASNYFISEGGSLAPQWRPTDKVTLTLLVSRENQNFTNLNTLLAAQTAPRFDRITAEQFNVFYTPLNRLTVNFFLRNEHRVSNEAAAFSYNDRIVSLSATYKFW